MSGLFDGMAGLVAGVFGKPVTYQPKDGLAREVLSVFRDQPVEALDGDGHAVLITSPSWRVQKHLVPELAKGDRIHPGNGRSYAVLNFEPTGSPATDAAVICELERVFE
ncbi:MAG: hypothetical protein A2092_16165 [Rhodobacteraceae bacterium GWE1_64_9]|nr:MAG: hypothetical protein A2092_16165 [Rhodobacteraceae bacterium GWE1_64_9]OHC50907.1 MAG: hypothetical protein A2X69_14185 [Rhodobacteraceae bacterium GWF1_65_7]HBD92145.1 hypothetical protein [Gemmobacter sp.]HBU13519.1 hypothetical protein [Gemmobacter sp.]